MFTTIRCSVRYNTVLQRCPISVRQDERGRSASESSCTAISSNNVCSLHMTFYSSTDTGITEKCVILHPFTVYQTLISCGPFIYHKGLWLCQPFSHHIRNDSPFLHPGYGGGYVAAVCTDLPFCIRLSLDDGSSALA